MMVCNYFKLRSTLEVVSNVFKREHYSKAGILCHGIIHFCALELSGYKADWKALPTFLLKKDCS